LLPVKAPSPNGEGLGGEVTYKPYFFISMFSFTTTEWSLAPISAGTGVLTESRAHFITDVTALTETVRLYLRPECYVPAGAIPPTEQTQPPVPYFFAEIGASTPLDTDIVMLPVGSAAQSNLKVTLRLEMTASVGGTLRITVNVFQVVGADQDGSSLNTHTDAGYWRNFLRKKALNPGVPSVFDTEKVMRLTLYARNKSYESAFAYTDSPMLKHRFYVSIGVPTMTRNDQPAEQLHLSHPTKVRFSITSSVPISDAWAMLMQVSGNDVEAITFANVLNISYIRAETDLATTFEDWGLSNTAFSPTVNSALQSDGDHYFFEVNLQPPEAGTYVLLSMWKDTDGGFRSLRSTEITTTAVPDLVPPEILGFLTDYSAVFGNALQASAGERIESKIYVNTDDYDAVRDKTFNEALNNIQITIYAKDGDLTHILEQENWQKQRDGTWLFPQQSEAGTNELTIGVTTLTLKRPFRLRYEPRKANLYSMDGGRLVPMSNQDWSGKRIFIEYRFRLVQEMPERFTDELVYTQWIDVLPVENSISAEVYTENLQPVRQWLAEYERLNVKLTVDALPSCYLLVLTDGATIHESNSCAGLLPKRNSTLFEPQQQTLTSGQAWVSIPAQAYPMNVPYSVLFIQKPIPELPS
jgi:hypothetical protein